MKRLAAAVALALALAGSAAPTRSACSVRRAATSSGAPRDRTEHAGPLPSADSPNAPGSIAFPDSVRSYPLVPETRTYAQLLDLWQQAGAAYGVSWEVLAAINKIESNFGRNMGPSSAGAIGWMQFMPSTWERWGLDGDGDGIAEPVEPGGRDPRGGALPGGLGRRRPTSPARSSRTTMRSGTWTRCSSWRSSSTPAASTPRSTSTSFRSRSTTARAVVVKTNRKLVKALRSVRALARHERALQRPRCRNALALRSVRPRSPRGSGRRCSSRRPGSRGRPPRDARAGRDGPRVRA